ncbi:MAG: hypothetical protein ABSH32_11115 [Bryobacteraceae bacterium]|jgi:hypothetical protein
MAEARGRSSARRTHVVLVPGFAGFDALGQLEYYARVTPQFRKWRTQNGRADVVLHYFDNFPTAAVATRAGRLRSYLAKRMARGEFMDHDALILVGHSTGGLDIRKLLWDLMTGPPGKTFPVDGGKGSAFTVKAAEILKLVRGIVFLSVPQWGTNIADWVRAYTLGRKVVIAELRATVAGSQVPLLDKLESWIASGATGLADVDLLRALQDALSEAQADTCNRDPARVAGAQEAASELELWLRHIATDFGAIDDLASNNAEEDPASPAHFPGGKRDHEKDLWRKQRIRTRSYATLGRRPFVFDPGVEAPQWDLLNPTTYPECTRREGPRAHTDIVYRTAYRACAGGPFHEPPVSDLASLQYVSAIQRRRIERWRTGAEIELWDNDGIVNTSSMLWPDGAQTRLVPGDHMDIVGHHRLVKAIPGSCREYLAYDLLKSGSEFDDSTFAEVWNDVFDFCV